ncbi:MAG: T9SS type A sorting domain-containing protein [Candidatus Cloacimonadaceae bacterium]|nr:T9SS type A sorting domain-containing protein [Candidatus Cloacimonadaceae bacterium]
MKKPLIMICMLVLLAVVSANPAVEVFGFKSARFDDAGDFWVEYFPHPISAESWENIRDLVFETNSGSFMLPDDYVGEHAEINLSHEIAGFPIDRNNDAISITNPNFPFGGFTNWGAAPNTDVHLRPLLPGQAAIMVPFIVNGFGGYHSWAKVHAFSGQILPPESHFCNVNVRVRCTNGHPVPGTVVALMFGFDQVNYTTNRDGIVIFHNWAIRYHIRVFVPQSEEPIAEYILYPEPNETITVEETVPCEHDPSQVPGVISVHPNLVHSIGSAGVKVSYDKYWQLQSDAKLRLYDLRGRELQAISFPPGGLLEWPLPPLANGIYFLSLRSGGRELARQRLTIIKSLRQ